VNTDTPVSLPSKVNNFGSYETDLDSVSTSAVLEASDVMTDDVSNIRSEEVSAG